MQPTLAETWSKKWDKSAQRGTYPFQFAPYDVAKQVIEAVIPEFEKDRESFTRGFAEAAEPYAEAGDRAAEKGDRKDARDNYQKAYGLFRMARFPCMNTDGKRAAYVRSQDCILKACQWDDIPTERIEMPFEGRDGEGTAVIGYLRRPAVSGTFPLMIIWAGIDTFKEDRLQATSMFTDEGMAVLCIEQPGTGDSPILGSTDAERQWDAMFDWVRSRDDLDASRVGGWGGSFGGYWATKLAHTHKDDFRAVVSQGGGAHLVFTPEQVDRSQQGGIPWGQSETRANSFGLKTHEEWRHYAPQLSLLEQGVLDQPCTSLLCVNGDRDPITPIEDYYLVLSHGQPKEARFVTNGAHMGRPLDGSPDPTPGIIVNWLKAKLMG